MDAYIRHIHFLLMNRILTLFFLAPFFLALSCSKSDNTNVPPAEIPDIINGHIIDFEVDPVDINTPDKGLLMVEMNNALYRVQFDAATQEQSNALIYFLTDTILTNESREYANLGADVVSYNPVKENEIVLAFYDGRKVTGLFNSNTNFGGAFGAELIAQWREPSDPSKPTQKAKDDLLNFVKRYDDKDGDGPGTAPVYLSAQVSKH